MSKEILLIFRKSADPPLAQGMAAYMKNRFVFLGLNRPMRNELQREILKGKRSEKQIDWDWIAMLYEQPEREFHYLALDYLRLMERKLEVNDLEKLEAMVRIHSWWDSVDHLAVIIGSLVKKEPELKQKMQEWITDPDMWIRRVSIIFQLKHGNETDEEFLERAIAANLGSKEFFINKAIGWALRQYSKFNPEWVRRFLEGFDLSPLSIREASKYL